MTLYRYQGGVKRNKYNTLSQSIFNFAENIPIAKLSAVYSKR